MAEEKSNQELQEENQYLRERIGEYMQNEEVQQVTIQALQGHASDAFETEIKLRAKLARLEAREDDAE